MLKYFLFVTCVILMQTRTPAQTQGKIEMYKYMAKDLPGSFQPIIHMQLPKNWYGEARYNYEEAQTFSLYAGKNFSGGKLAVYSLTPMIGYSVGIFTGLSLALNTDLEWKDFYFSIQSQYSISSRTSEDNFFFSWSELGYSISDHFFTGFTLQHTSTSCETNLEPGIVSGVSFKNFEIPFYLFNPFGPGKYFVLGLSYEFSIGKKK